MTTQSIKPKAERAPADKQARQVRNYSTEILKRLNEAEASRRKSGEHFCQYNKADALKDAAAKAFAALNGWLVTKRRSFHTNTLARGGTHDNRRDYYASGFHSHELFDHAVYFRWASRPYKAAAIVGQPYTASDDEQLNEQLERAYAEAQKLGLKLHVPTNLTASWWYPTKTAFFCFTRPAQRVVFLPEQTEPRQKHPSEASE